MSISSIHTAIKNKLDTLVPTTLKEVYGYKINPLEQEFAAFPVAELVESGNEADYLSTKENIRTYPFDIYLYQGVEEAGGVNEAYSALRLVVDTVIDSFDNDQSISGAADWVEPAISGFSDFPRRNKTIAVAIITLKCHKAKLLS